MKGAPGNGSGVQASAVPGALAWVVPCLAGNRIFPAQPGRAVPVLPRRVSRSTRGRCYPCEVTGAEWAVIEPSLPAPGWLAGQGGFPGTYCRRDVVDAIRYLVHNGCVWRALPADLPHWRTVYGYVRTWQASGATRRMHDELR